MSETQQSESNARTALYVLTDQYAELREERSSLQRQLQRAERVVEAARGVKAARDKAMGREDLFAILQAITQKLYPALAAYDALEEQDACGD